MNIEYTKPCNGQRASYNPETEGYYILKFKHGVTQADLYLAPFPSNTFVQLGLGYVGEPRRNFELAMRDLCAFVARWPEKAGLVAIYKCPFAFAEFASFVPLTDLVDQTILAQAKRVDWQYWFSREQYFSGKQA